MKGHLYIISDFPDDYTHTPQGQLGSTASTGHNPLAALPISPSPTIICNNNNNKNVHSSHPCHLLHHAAFLLCPVPWSPNNFFVSATRAMGEEV